MKKGVIFDADVEGYEYIWEPTPNGGDFTVISYRDKYHRRCKKEDAVSIVTMELKNDGTLVNMEWNDEPALDEGERREGQLLHAEDYAKENNWAIKDYAFDKSYLFVRYSNPNSFEDVIVRIDNWLFNKIELTELAERNSAMKIIRSARDRRLRR